MKETYFTSQSIDARALEMRQAAVGTMRSDNPLSQIAPDFDLSQGRVLEKSQSDAFYQTDLEERLRSLGISQVVVGGVMTHLCCETTARDAFGRGFEVFFLVDEQPPIPKPITGPACLTWPTDLLS